MSAGTTKIAGIKGIAEALGTSIGTVDRALHGRSGVSPAMRDRVLRVAEEMNYKPNLAARHLKLNRQLTIGVFLPQEIASFFNLVRDGIRAAATASGANVDLHYDSFPRLGEGEAEALEAGNWEKFDGLILALGDPDCVRDFWASVAKRHKPVVVVGNDAPHSSRIAGITVDGYVSGSIAADLLGRAILAPSQVAILTGDLHLQDHSDKLRGFAASLALFAPHLTLLPAIECHDREKDAYAATLTLLKTSSGLGGIYVNTANSIPVIRAIEEMGAFDRIRLVTTDLFPEIVPRIENGQVLATLEQRPFTQGRLAFEALASFLATGRPPVKQTRLAPHIVLRSNISIFMDRITT